MITHRVFEAAMVKITVEEISESKFIATEWGILSELEEDRTVHVFETFGGAMECAFDLLSKWTYAVLESYEAEEVVNLMRRRKFMRPTENVLHEPIYHDTNKGVSVSYSYQDIVDDVRSNPFCSDGCENEQYYFASDGSHSYSIAEIAEIENIKLEIEE